MRKLHYKLNQIYYMY